MIAVSLEMSDEPLKIMNYYELVSLTFFSYFCKKIAALLHKNINRSTKVPPLT